MKKEKKDEDILNFKHGCEDAIMNTTTSIKSLMFVLGAVNNGMMTPDNNFFNKVMICEAIGFQYDLYVASCEVAKQTPKELADLALED